MNAGPETIPSSIADHAGGQHLLHAASASTTASSPIERLALTSTASPGRSTSGHGGERVVERRRTSVPP